LSLINKELDDIKAEEYLEKARTMFEEMGLQWDMDELEKFKLQMGTCSYCFVLPFIVSFFQ
jgi:hypothetical protein